MHAFVVEDDVKVPANIAAGEWVVGFRSAAQFLPLRFLACLRATCKPWRGSCFRWSITLVVVSDSVGDDVWQVGLRADLGTAALSPLLLAAV